MIFHNLEVKYGVRQVDDRNVLNALYIGAACGRLDSLDYLARTANGGNEKARILIKDLEELKLRIVEVGNGVVIQSSVRQA